MDDAVMGLDSAILDLAFLDHHIRNWFHHFVQLWCHKLLFISLSDIVRSHIRLESDGVVIDRVEPLSDYP